MTTWMVVEDEPDIKEMVKAMFQIWGVGGIAFSDGMEAVNWIQQSHTGKLRSEIPDLALLDIRLPTLSGVEVAARLRRSRYLAGITIVLFTAYRLSPEHEQEVMTMSQADGLLYKPLPEMDDLRVYLENLVTARRERKGLPYILGSSVKKQ